MYFELDNDFHSLHRQLPAVEKMVIGKFLHKVQMSTYGVVQWSIRISHPTPPPQIIRL